MDLTETDWGIRLSVYEALAASGYAPSARALGARFAIAEAEARQALQRLHDAHALVLEAESGKILMAHPFSAAPSDYRVFIGKTAYYANCAWDSLGIPAMLGADARIEARHPLSGEIVEYRVDDSKLIGGRNALAHFAKPFRHWYDDILDT